MKPYTVLSIAGSDCSGGAGIQADLKTISALGCYAATVITAVTVQNTCGVENVFPVPTEIIKAQIESVMNDIQIDAIKIGMVTDCTVIRMLAEILQQTAIPVVFDPVLISSSGYPLMQPEAINTMYESLLPCCTLLTPNIPETEVLSHHTIKNVTDMHNAGRKILQSGCKAVLVKGGHLNGSAKTDVLIHGMNGELSQTYEAPEIHTNNSHGTGCTLSSAIAAWLAQGFSVPEAVAKGKIYLTEALAGAQNLQIGHGHGPLNHFFNPKKLIVR